MAAIDKAVDELILRGLTLKEKVKEVTIAGISQILLLLLA
jgi:hypothetical protein